MNTLSHVLIRRNSDRLVRIHRESSGPSPWDETTEYLWEGGNWACDCNRSLFFKVAAGNDDPESDDCGDGAYSVCCVATDGTTLYEDGDWDWSEPQKSDRSIVEGILRRMFGGS